MVGSVPCSLHSLPPSYWCHLPSLPCLQWGLLFTLRGHLGKYLPGSVSRFSEASSNKASRENLNGVISLKKKIWGFFLWLRDLSRCFWGATDPSPNPHHNLMSEVSTIPIWQMQKLRLREAKCYLLKASLQWLELDLSPGNLTLESQPLPQSSTFSLSTPFYKIRHLRFPRRE